MVSSILEAPSLETEQDSMDDEAPSFSIDISSLISLPNLKTRDSHTSKAEGVKRRHRISLETKKAIIDMHDAKVPLKEISLKFGLTKSTISSVVNQRKLVEQAWMMGRQGKSSKLRKGKYPEVETAVLEWIRIEREKDPDAQFPGLLIQDKATDIAKILNVEFQASNGWLQRFKTRFRAFFKNGNCSREVDPELAQKPEFNGTTATRKKKKFNDQGEVKYTSDELLISKWLRELKESGDVTTEVKPDHVTVEELFRKTPEVSDNPEKGFQDQEFSSPKFTVNIRSSTPLPNDQLGVLASNEAPSLLDAIKACDTLSRYLQGKVTGTAKAFQLLLGLEREIVQNM